MIELFSRKPDVIKEVEGMHLTDIPTGEDVSSLSAILLDDEYYNFTLSHTILSDGLHHATEIALICLKAKACLNNMARKLEGQTVRTDDIKKHKNDILRLAVTLTPNTRVEAPEVIKQDLRNCIQILREEPPDIKQVLKGQSGIKVEQIITLIEQTFNL